MWDDNRLIFVVHPLLNNIIKENSLVLVRYGAPEETVVKQLEASEGKETWALFKQYKEKLNKKIQPIQLDIPMEQSPFKGMVR